MGWDNRKGEVFMSAAVLLLVALVAIINWIF